MNVFDQRIVEDEATNKRIAELLHMLPLKFPSSEFTGGKLYPDFTIRLDLAVMLPPPPGRRFELINLGDRTMIRYAPLEMLPSSTESWINCASRPVHIARAICRLWLEHMDPANSPN